MKRCPECRRDYYDDTLLYCLDDGNALLEGPASGSGTGDEPATAILSEPGAIATGFRGGEDHTRQFVHTTDETAILQTGAVAEPQRIWVTRWRSSRASPQIEPQSRLRYW
ncbi:MAG: hypothetical protein IPP63_11405 [Chloracidobacterium sp.]|nr:hypothetical protein [Chloracidobacterium sp.]